MSINGRIMYRVISVLALSLLLISCGGGGGGGGEPSAQNTTPTTTPTPTNPSTPVVSQLSTVEPVFSNGANWNDYVKIDPRYFRPTEVDYLLGDSSRARKILNWEPRVYFRDLVRVMVDADLELMGLEAPGEGRKILEAHHGKWHRWEDQVVSMEG